MFYTAGAVVYARGRPDPRPAVFGYHEVFHVLVVVAAVVHFVAVAAFALPQRLAAGLEAPYQPLTRAWAAAVRRSLHARPIQSERRESLQ